MAARRGGIHQRGCNCSISFSSFHDSDDFVQIGAVDLRDVLNNKSILFRLAQLQVDIARVQQVSYLLTVYLVVRDGKLKFYRPILPLNGIENIYDAPWYEALELRKDE